MDLNAIALFVAAVQTGSLSAAAARLDVPLPTLSRRIKQLEQGLAVQLMERSARGIKPTEAGMRLYEHASRGVELLAEAEEAVRSDQAQLKGRLRLSIPPAMEPWWDLLRDFQAQYPGIRLAIYATERRIDLIQDGVDVALRVGAIVDESMVARPVASYRHVLVASPKLIARLGNPKSVDDLHRFPCAVWASGPGAHSEWRLGERTFGPAAVIAANDYQQLRRRALAGDVLTELPPFLARQDLASGTLVGILARHPFPDQPIQLLYPSHRHPSSLVRAYIEFCMQHAVRCITGHSTIKPRPAG
jgi:DNA-binding transcriptional LysR family regulator